MAEQSKSVQKSELKKLIKQAAAGSDEAAHRLISPFVNPEEKLIQYGISAKFGLIATYDFLFITDRRIGDLEITPLNGNLNVEVAYLQKIDAYVLRQPAFPILLRLSMLLLYPLSAILGFVYTQQLGFAFGIAEEPLQISGVLVGLLFALAILYVINPLIKRTFLRFRKSGLWCKLNGHPIGVYIFADRDKFVMLTQITRHMNEIKRQLDKISM